MKMWQLFKTKSKWTQGASARNKAGKITMSTSRSAVSFCLIGALYRCYTDYFERREIRTRISRKIPSSSSMAEWNDKKSRTFTEVKRLVKELDI